MIVSSARKLAEVLGVTHTRINDLVKEKKITRGPGGFDLDLVRSQLAENLDLAQPNKIGRSQQDGSDKEPSVHALYNKARAIKERTAAENAELDLKVRKGQLVDGESVANKWAEVGTSVRDAFMSLPIRVVNRVPEEWRREINVIVDEEVRKALKAISDEFRPIKAT